MSGRRFTGHEPAAGHDTHGLPWAGRDLTTSPFDGDTGAADPELLAALQSGDEGAVMAVLSRAGRATPLRVLVPIVAHPDEVDETGDLAVDARTDMASVVLTAPDGRRALPIFSGLAALTDWDANARPVPVTVADAARAAIDDTCDVLLLDLGAPHALVLRLSQLWALAQDRPWLPPHADPVVLDAVAAAAGEDPCVDLAHVEPADQGLLRVALTLTPGLDRDRVTGVVEAFGTRLGADPDVRIRIDGLALTLRGRG